MRTVTKTLFTFNELTEENKKKAIDNYREKNDGYLFDNNDAIALKEDMFYLLNEDGIDVKDKEIYWSLSWCQGDGLVILGDITQSDIEKILKDNGENDLMEIVKFAEFSATIKHNSIYYHSGTMDFYFDDTLGYREKQELVDFMINTLGTSQEDIDGLDLDTLYNTLRKDIFDIEDYIKDYFVSKANKFEKKGYNAIERTWEDDYVEEILSENDCIEFLEDGKLYR